MVDCKNQNIEWYSSKMLEENNGDLGSLREGSQQIETVSGEKSPCSINRR